MGRRLLIVDDDAEFRRLGGRLLEADGYTLVGTAADAKEALKAAGELSPEVVLLDVNLPDESGFALAARLADGRSNVAVVLTSTHDRRDYWELAMKSGARGFLMKDTLSGAELDRLLA
jgi:DNA-binding NarL/FixJ family response regulator